MDLTNLISVRVSITVLFLLCSPNPIDSKPNPSNSYDYGVLYPLPLGIDHKIEVSEKILRTTQMLADGASKFIIAKKQTLAGIQKLHIVKNKILTAKINVFKFKKSLISKGLSGWGWGWGWPQIPTLPLLPEPESVKRLGVRMGYMGGSWASGTMRNFMRGFQEMAPNFTLSANDTGQVVREPTEGVGQGNQTNMSKVHQFFNLLTELDTNGSKCFEKLICDIHARNSMNGPIRNGSNFEEGMISIFRLFDYPDNQVGLSTFVNDPVTYKYILAADFGKEYSSISGCANKYKLCPFSTNEIIEFGNEMPDSKGDDGIPLQIS